MKIFSNGKINGECIHYYRYGEIQSRYNYKNGTFHGPETHYYKNGNIKE